MRRSSRRRVGTLRTAAMFTLGAVTGSIVSLLYAPTSGRNVRKRFAVRARGLKRLAARRLLETQRELGSQAGHVREAASEWIAECLPHRNGNGHARRHHTTTRRRRVIRHAAAHR